jgi:ABC-type Fe3+/spermidine/putrescine transport system ATPase subunit
MILVTHDVEECFQLADTLYFIEKGRCLQWGKKDDVIARPASLEVAALLGIYAVAAAEITYLDPGNNVSRVRIAGQTLETRYLPGHFLGDRGWICVRRSELSVLPYPPEAEANQIVVHWRLRSTTVHGVHLDFEDGLSAEVSTASFAELQGSARVRLEFPSDAVHFVTS